MAQLTVSEFILNILTLLNVKHMFGINGACIEHFVDSTQAQPHYPVPVLVRREDTAAYAADFQSRSHSAVAVCFSTSGAGWLNLLPGIAESYANMSAVLAITGIADRSGAFQDCSGINRAPDGQRLSGCLTKYSATITRSDDFLSHFREALHALLVGVPGPVWLMISRSVLSATIDYDEAYWRTFIAQRDKPFPPVVQAFSPDTVAALNVIRHAKDPVLLFGQEAKWSLSSKKLNEVLHEQKYLTATTITGRGLLDEGSPYFAGVVGVIGNIQTLEYLKTTCDIIICIGAELNDVTFVDFQQWEKVILVSEWGACLCHGRNVQMQINVSPWEFIKALPVRQYSSYIPDKHKIPSYHNEESSGSTINYPDAIRALDKHIQLFDHIVYDAGNCATFAWHYLSRYNSANHHIAMGMGGMGYAFAAAVALAQMPSIKSRLIIAGDGAFLMSGFEIHTVTSTSTSNILYLIFNDSAHGMIKTRQNIYLGERHVCSTYPEINIQNTAHQLGVKFCKRVYSVSQLQTALSEYKNVMSIGVIEIVIDNDLTPPFIPFINRS